ncbi:minor capsid protein [uncultured Fusobacterium sp.]|uniref:minor capsid protein n=1 Tax=uncultured Fusobacterium sp. TaxID=159267 RepID=UPI002805724F|nr:minor capsid protein [uncultured Fusobacterium sp.]
MDKKSKEYWEKRARENENKVYKKASDLKKELDVHYIQAKREIQKSINDLIARYMFKTDLSYADAMKYLTSKEFKEFRMSLEEYEAEIERLSEINEELANRLRIELETLAMKSRITRLDSLKTQIDIELSKKISKDYNVVEKGISEVYRDFFKIQTTDFGLTGVNTVLPKKTLKMLMQQPWSGANFSERIWGNSEALGKVLKQEIIQSFMQGVSVKDLSDRIEKRFENDRYNTERLVRTELNYAFNQTTKLSYEEAEIEEYEFLAEIDSRTSEICKKLNRKKFKVKDARAGVNYPPMHPHCRSTTVAVLDFDNFGKEKITYEEEKAIMDYKSPDGKMYILNDKLRQGFELNEEEKEWIKNLDSFLKKMPCYKGDLIRTIELSGKNLHDFLWNNKIGDIIKYKAYTSASKGEIYEEDMPIWMYIKNSKKARNISGFGLSEDEVLYERNCKFKILDVYLHKGKYCLELEEIDE